MATKKRPQTAGGSGQAGPPAPTTTAPASPTTTVAPAPTTTVPPLSPEDQAIVDAIINSLPPWLQNTNENKRQAIAQAGVAYVDKQTGRVIYEGITRTLPSGEELQPRYFEGDEYDITALDPVQIRNLQDKLQKGRFYLNDKFTIGTVGPETIRAYKRALEVANLNFLDVDTVLENAQTVPYAGGVGGGGLSRYRVTSSSDLSRIFDTASQSVLGRTLDPEEVSKLVKAYQATELGSLQSKQTVGTQAPTAQSFGAERIEAENTDEADAYKFTQYAQAFEQLLGR